jgi:hypothetical protein
MQIWIFGGLAAASLAVASAVVTTPIVGPLYTCHAPAGAQPPVVSWADDDGVVVVAGRPGQALPGYVFGAAGRPDATPQRLRLARSALEATTASLTVPSGLSLACELNNED